MDCATCKARLATAEQLFFYEKGDTKVIHLASRPECRYSLLSTMKLVEPKRKKRKKIWKVLCRNCDKGIGSDLPFGPANASFIAFAKDSVTLFGELPHKKQSWNTMSCYSRIAVRGDDNFFGSQESVISAAESLDPSCETGFARITFPSLTKLKHFSWDKLLTNSENRIFKIKC